MKRIRAIIAACLVYVLFVSVFGRIVKNNAGLDKTFTTQLSEIDSNGVQDPMPPPPPPLSKE